MENTDEKKQAAELTAKQKKFLKGLGHTLSPVVAIGKDGLGQKIVKAANLELSRHELIKVKVGKSSPADKKEVAKTLSRETESSLVQVIGRTILLYKKNPKLDKEKQIRIR